MLLSKVFNRGHATLNLAVSICPSGRPSVHPSVRPTIRPSKLFLNCKPNLPLLSCLGSGLVFSSCRSLNSGRSINPFNVFSLSVCLFLVSGLFSSTHKIPHLIARTCFRRKMPSYSLTRQFCPYRSRRSGRSRRLGRSGRSGRPRAGALVQPKSTN